MGFLRRLGEGIGGIFGRPDLGRDIGGFVGTVTGINGRNGGGGGLPIPQGGQRFPAMLQDPRQLPAPQNGGAPTFGGFPIPLGGSGIPSPPAGNGQNGQFAGDVGQLLGGNQLVMEPQQKVINSAPPGWVIATLPDGTKKAVRKEVAKCLGLWKPRKKPPISASDWSKLKRARAVEKKAKKIAQTANFKCTKK